MSENYFHLGIDADEWVRMDHPASIHKWWLADDIKCGEPIAIMPFKVRIAPHSISPSRNGRYGLLAWIQQKLSPLFQGRVGAKFD